MAAKKETFVTKDSGERQQYASGMYRDTTAGKPLWSLLLPVEMPLAETLLYRWVMLLTRGAEKYAARNWEKAAGRDELDRARDSAFRHFMQWMGGDRDEDHAAAVIFNLQLAEYVRWKLSSGNNQPEETK